MNVSEKELIELIGKEKSDIFKKISNEINTLYDMGHTWNNGGKNWNYEYKYRKSGRTLCGFYFKNNVLGIMIIFGKQEREKVEILRKDLSKEIINNYDNAKTYHDGKWVMFELDDSISLEDIKKLLSVKRRPNRK